MPFTNEEKLQAIRRELGYRRRVFENRVNRGLMSEAQSKREIALFEEIEADYQAKAQGERLL